MTRLRTLLFWWLTLSMASAICQSRNELLGRLATTEDPKERLVLLANAAMRSFHEGDGEEARDLALYGLDLSAGMDQPGPRSVCSQVLAELDLSSGKPQQALPHALRAVVFGREDGPREEGRASFLLARIYSRLGLHGRAADVADVALSSAALEPLQACWAHLAMAKAIDAEKHPAEAAEAFKQCLSEARQVRATDIELECLGYISNSLGHAGNLVEAITVTEELIVLCRTTGSPKETGVAYNNLGELLSRSGRYEDAVTAFGEAGSWLTNEPQVRDRMLMNLSIALARAGRVPQAHSVLDNLLTRSEDRGELANIPHILVLRGGIHLLDGRLTQAWEVGRDALKRATELSLLHERAEAMTLLERVAQERGSTTEARALAQRGQVVQEEIWDERRNKDRAREEQVLGLLRKESELVAQLNAEQKDRMELMQTILEAENQGKQIDIDQYKAELQRSFESQEALLQEQARQAVDLANATLEAERRDNEIAALEGQRQMQVLQLTKLDLERQQKENAMSMLKRQNELLESDRLLKASEQRRDKMISRFAVAIIIILAGLTVFAYWVMGKVRAKNRIIRTQVKEIEGINQQLNHSNEEMLSSIRYAQRIQSTIVPSIDLLRSMLPDSFVYYKPRDVVSGDLPFVRRKGDHLYIAAIDCTGHGVPAAMLSFIAYYNLNDLITTRATATPALILEELHQRMLSTTEGADGRASLSDGMDVGLARVDLSSGDLVFAGAQMSMMIEKDGVVQRVKGDLCSIGDRFGRNTAGFIDHFHSLSNKERIYLFSDGLAHQFGGQASRQKFSYKRMSENFQRMGAMETTSAEQHITTTFEQWKVDCEQTDDVLLISFSMRGNLSSKAA